MPRTADDEFLRVSHARRRRGAVMIASVALLAVVGVHPKSIKSVGDAPFGEEGLGLSLRARESDGYFAWGMWRPIAATASHASSAAAWKSACFCACAVEAVGHAPAELPEVMEELGNNTDIVEELGNNTDGPLFICGQDRDHRPTLVARPSRHVIPDTTEESIEAAWRCIRTVGNCLDQMKSGQGQMTVIFDLGGAGPRNLDLTFSRELAKGMIEQFPDRLARVLIINVHWTTSLAWAAVRGFMHPDTCEKIIFCGSDFRSTLLQYVDEEHPYLQHVLDGKPLIC